jgi:hypothetical protein
LIEDTRALPDGEPKPDLLVLSGDLAERGMPAELAACRSFIDHLCDCFGLATDKVIVVPGNHDVNRERSEAYFLEREAEDRAPAEPFDAKWHYYTELVTGLHGAGAFTPERPYRLHVIAQLGLVVAAMNPTMRESHREDDRYGWCGEELPWFTRQLEYYDGWARVGVVCDYVPRHIIARKLLSGALPPVPARRVSMAFHAWGSGSTLYLVAVASTWEERLEKRTGAGRQLRGVEADELVITQDASVLGKVPEVVRGVGYSNCSRTMT